MHAVAAWVTVHNPCVPACCMDKRSLLSGPKHALAWSCSLTTFLTAVRTPQLGGTLASQGARWEGWGSASIGAVSGALCSGQELRASAKAASGAWALAAGAEAERCGHKRRREVLFAT